MDSNIITDSPVISAPIEVQSTETLVEYVPTQYDLDVLRELQLLNLQIQFISIIIPVILIIGFLYKKIRRLFIVNV